MFLCPRSVIIAVVVDETRGSRRVICRAELPAASICEEETEGREVIENRLCEVVRVSTTVEVVRSSVLTVWSWEAEYANVGSSGWKITAVVGAECAGIRDRGPRCGVDVDVASLRRLEDMSDEGAAGASALLVLQIPTVPSKEAESMREVVPWTAIESTLPLWPYSSNVGLSSAEKWS